MKSWFLKGLVALTVVSGAVIAALQASSASKARAASGVLGVLVMISVGLKDAFFDVDFRTIDGTIGKVEFELSLLVDDWKDEDLSNPRLCNGSDTFYKLLIFNRL